jgi:3-O-methylgallate 3,4-dioxygenase
MAKLAAAFGSSHSVMLAAELEDWLRGFRQSDLRMKYNDRQGKPRSYAEVLARAPANIAELVADEAITARYHQVQEAMKRLRAEIAQARLDALVVVGDDQHELFQDQHMPSIGIYYGESIRRGARQCEAFQLAQGGHGALRCGATRTKARGLSLPRHWP